MKTWVIVNKTGIW